MSGSCWACHEYSLSEQELRIYSFINSCEKRTIMPNQIYKEFKLSATATSNVLHKLEMKGLLRRDSSPRFRTYTAIGQKP